MGTHIATIHLHACDTGGADDNFNMFIKQLDPNPSELVCVDPPPDGKCQ